MAEETTQQFVIGGGLRKHVPDHRDFSHHKSFGSAPISVLPDTYLLLTDILNQGGSQKCTAYAACAIAQAQFGVAFDPDQFYDDEGVENKAVSMDGYDLRTTCQTAVDIGFKQSTNTNGGQITMKEESYFSVDGPYDLFDSIRSAMYLAKDEKACVELGTMWFKEWTYAQGGMITDSVRTPSGLHAIKCAGWKTIAGVTYLVIQNSYGEGFGDKGVWYFPRSVVNKEFVEGHYMWRSTPAQTNVKTIGRITVIISQILNLMKSFLISIGFNET